MAASVRFLDNDGASVITLDSLPDAFAGDNQTPRKVGIHSTSTRNLINLLASIGIVGGNDGASQLRTALDSASVQPTVSAPYGFAASVGGGTGSFAATGTYGYRMLAVNALGATFPCDEITAVVDLTTRRVTLTWTQTPGATGYRIYRTPTPGAYGASTLLTTIGSGATTSYNDDGAATTLGTLTTTNTTGGWNLAASLGGAGGVWGSTGTRFWRVVALDATGVEIANSFEASFNVTDTTKKVTLTWAPVAEAASFKIYRSTVSGTYSDPAVAGTASSGATTFDDTGAAVTTGSLTTGFSYGIPPTSGNFGTGSLVLGSTVVPGQEVYIWLNRVVPGGTPEVGNPRQATIAVTES
jgi:hypothetical protein